jgi:NADPH2:quinone reductase
MRAMRVAKYGDPNAIQLEDLPKPKPGPGEALVRVQAVGVNFADVYMRNGAARMPVPMPYTLGIEGAGTVEEVGAGVTDVKVGDRVAYATRGLGSYADYQVVNASVLVPLPDDISFEKGAAVILQGLTAHYLIHEFYPIKSGTTVMVHAAAGGMGLLLCQWLRRFGAEVIGTVSTEEKAKIAHDAGAEHTILYTKQDFAEEAQKITGGKGVEYIIDGVGKTTFTKNLDAVAMRGWITVFGMSSGPADPLLPLSLMTKSVTLSGGAVFNYLLTRDELLDRAQEVFRGIHQGWLRIHIDHTFPLEQASNAHRLIESRQTTGKLILTTGN